MPTTYDLVQNVITSGRAPAFEVQTGNGMIVEAGVIVSSDISSGIVLDGSNHLTLKGYASGYQGVFDFMGGSTVDITSSGAALGSFVGLELGKGSTLNNYGMVSGNYYGTYVQGSATINNAGIIQVNQSGGVALYFYLGTTHTLDNYGLIRNRFDGDAIRTQDSGGGDAEHIVNFGQIFGRVWLGGGNDSFDTTTGVATGTIDLGAGNDTARGSAAADTILGGAGNDIIRGNEGADSLDGGDGAMDFVVFADKTDTIVLHLQDGGNISVARLGGVDEDSIANFEGVIGGSFGDFLVGSGAANIIDGGRGNDTLFGASGNDTLYGGAGDDLISGGPGFDQLTGDAGADAFRFDATPSSANIDTITDFTHGTDRIELGDAQFFALTNPWSAAQFKSSASGHVADTVDQHILYDQSTGILWYDPDGSGVATAMAFAKLGYSTHPTVDWTDFAVV